jgi:DNA adenine methylase
MFKSFIKYPGGKSKVLPHILPHFQPAEVFVEPFVGSGVVFLNTDYARYILADINADLINLYKEVKKDSAKFIFELKKLFIVGNNLEAQYYKFREEFNTTCDVFRKSLLFVWLNRHCFNGLCRYNASGKFNVPYGKYKSVYFPETEILYFGQKLQNAELLNCDFGEVFDKIVDQDCVVYCDPPYDPISTTSSFVGYAGNAFGKKEQQELANRVFDCVGIVVASNANTPFVRKIYKAAKMKSINVQRNISQKSASRVKVKEVVIVKGRSYDRRKQSK